MEPSDNNEFSKKELLEIGFEEVGSNVQISRDVRFFAIKGRLGNNVRIDTYSILSGHIELFDNVHIAPLCFLSATGGKIMMAAGSGMGPQVAMLTRSDDYTAASTKAADKVYGHILVGENSILGAGGKILPGVNIGDNVSIGSNCVVSSDIQAGEMVVSRGASLVTVGHRESGL